MDAPAPTPKPRKTYPQNWPAYNKGQTEEGRLFDPILVDLLKTVHEPPPNDTGRPRIPLREQLFCAIRKTYEATSLRRTHSVMDRASQDGHISRTPHWSGTSRFLLRADVKPILRDLVTASALPLAAVEEDFAIDSSGFATTRFGSYGTHKWHNRGQPQHGYVKGHILIGTATHVICAAETTPENGADIHQLAPLLGQIKAAGFKVRDFTADKAYVSRASYEAVKAVGGDAIIPFRSNMGGRSFGSMYYSKMFHYFQVHRDAFMRRYHRRSNVEATFSAIKRKLFEGLFSKETAALENEALCKFIAYNITVLIHEIHEHGITPLFRAVAKR